MVGPIPWVGVPNIGCHSAFWGYKVISCLTRQLPWLLYMMDCTPKLWVETHLYFLRLRLSGDLTQQCRREPRQSHQNPWTSQSPFAGLILPGLYGMGGISDSNYNMETEEQRSLIQHTKLRPTGMTDANNKIRISKDQGMGRIPMLSQSRKLF